MADICTHTEVVMIAFRVNESLRDAVKIAAIQSRLTVQEWITRAITERLEIEELWAAETEAANG